MLLFIMYEQKLSSGLGVREHTHTQLDIGVTGINNIDFVIKTRTTILIHDLLIPI